jgi:hypothetical protein
MFLNSILVFNAKKSRVICMNLLLRFRIWNSVHKILRNSVEFRGIKRVENSAEFRESKVTSA